MLGIRDRLTFDPRDSWQVRTLNAATDKTGAVLLSVLAHKFDLSLRCAFDVLGWSAYLRAPYLTSAGRIAKNGKIIARLMEPDGVERWRVFYRNEIELRDDFRKLADQLKLSDSDRAELLSAVKEWIVADRRLDPTMDPKDPDAKRLH